MDRIIYIKKENGGPASARNIALKRSTGEYICFLDADDIFLPHKLESQVDFMEKNPECGLVFADASIIGEKETIKRESLLGGLPVYQGHVFRHLFINNFIITLTVMIRREVLDKCGLFDESLSVCSDYELWLRIAMDYQIRYLNETLSIYRIHSTNISSDVKKVIEHHFIILEKFKRDFPSLEKKYPGIFEEKYAFTKNRLGFYYFEKREFRRAKREFIGTIKTGRRVGKALLGYVSSLLRFPALYNLSKLAIELFLKGSYLAQEGNFGPARVCYLKSIIVFPFYYKPYFFLFYTFFKKRFKKKFTIEG